MRFLVAAMLLLGCKARDTGEAAYVDKELGSLEKAIAEASESRMTVECASLATSLPRSKSDVVAKIEKLCYVEVPRILLRKAIAEAKEKAKTTPPEMAALGCMQLFAPDAVVTVDKHPSHDAELEQLVAEYT